MPFMVETERNILNETNEWEDTTEYSNANNHDWTTRATKTIVFSETEVVVVNFTFKTAANPGSPSSSGAARLTIDDDPIISKHIQTVFGELTSHTVGCILELAAGSYVFDFDSAIYDDGSGTNSLIITDIYVGTVDFTDDVYADSDSGFTSVSAASTGTLATDTLTIPATRKTPVGNIRKYHGIIQVYAEQQTSRSTVFKNVGESNESDRMNISIFVDDVQKDWTSSENDETLDATNNLTNGEGAYGVLAYNFAPSSSPVVKVKAYNGWGVSKNTKILVKYAISPWFAGDLCEPVDFNFPQGSTLYIVSEPVFKNVSKDINIGFKRAIPFSADNNYFSTTTGTDRDTVNYTFNSVKVDTARLYISGVGNAISFIGVDIR